jgi:hypothetical protein
MTHDENRGLLYAKPFKASAIYMVDGRVLNVYLPDYCFLPPTPRGMGLVTDQDDEDRFNYNNTNLISRIVPFTDGKSKRKKAG